MQKENGYIIGEGKKKKEKPCGMVIAFVSKFFFSLKNNNDELICLVKVTKNKKIKKWW